MLCKLAYIAACHLWYNCDNHIYVTKRIYVAKRRCWWAEGVAESQQALQSSWKRRPSSPAMSTTYI